MAADIEDHDANEEGGCASGTKQGCGCLGVALLLGVGGTLGSMAFSYYPLAAWGVVVSAALLVGGGVAGAFVGSYPLGTVTRRQMRIGGKVVLGFGVACLLTVIGMTLRPSRFQFEAEVSPGGGTVGPVEVPHNDMRVDVHVRQSIEEGAGRRYQRWSFVTVELLDQNETYLSSFGGGFWHYAGYDGEYWEESDREYETTLRMPSAGTYHLRLKTEANVNTAELHPIRIEMHERAWWGNPVPVRLAAYLAFFLGGVFVVAPRMGQSRRLVSHLSNGGKVRYNGQTWRVGGQLHCTYDDWVADEWSLQPTDPGTKKPRYLEREYETGSNWENWLIARPVALDQIHCTDADGAETTVERYVSTRGDLPDTVMVDGTRYTLEGDGTARREGASIPYRNYEDNDSGFVTIEGTPSDTLEAVAGDSISVADVTIVVEDDDANELQ